MRVFGVFLASFSPALASPGGPGGSPQHPLSPFPPLPTLFFGSACIPERSFKTLCALFKRHPILSTGRWLTVGRPTFGPLRGRTSTADWPVTVQVWPRGRDRWQVKPSPNRVLFRPYICVNQVAQEKLFVCLLIRPGHPPPPTPLLFGGSIGRDRWVGPNRLNHVQIQFCFVLTPALIKCVLKSVFPAG